MKRFSLIFIQIISGIALHAQPALEWMQGYDGAGPNDDTPCATVVDANGNVFVAGSASDTNATSAFVTLKYSNAGMPIWTNLFHGLPNQNDHATAMAIAPGGDVVVVGNSASTNGSRDCITIAYSNAGLPLWTNRFNGPANSEDIVDAICPVTNGNICITGHARLTNIYDGLLTIMYSNSGTPIWTNIYSDARQGSSWGVKVTPDALGNVFVAGRTSVITPSNSTWEIVVLGYSNAGDPLWTNHYAGPNDGVDVATAISCDGLGNVLVAGYSAGPGAKSDFVVIKYSPNGIPLWTNRYDGLGNDEDWPIGMTVDSSNNVFVTGWSQTPVTGFPNARMPDFATIAFSTDGTPLWTNVYDGPISGGYNRASAILADVKGNVFVTGYSTSGDTTNGYPTTAHATIKYSNGGVSIWTNRFNSLPNNTDTPVGMAMDAGGNLFITGFSGLAGGNYHFLTLKYSSEPPAEWVGIQRDGNQVILTWTNPLCNLQAATVVNGVFTNIPGATSPHTNQVSEPQKFFRLISN